MNESRNYNQREYGMREILVKIQIPEEEIIDGMVGISEWLTRCIPENWMWSMFREPYSGEVVPRKGTIRPDLFGKGRIAKWSFDWEKGTIDLHGWDYPIRAVISEVYRLHLSPGGLNYMEDFPFAEKKPVEIPVPNPEEYEVHPDTEPVEVMA